MVKKPIIYLLFTAILISTVQGFAENSEKFMQIEVESQMDKDFEQLPIKVEIDSSELESLPYLNSRCDLPGSNLGFVNTDENREYDFWIEEGSCDEGDFTAWVNVPFVQEESFQQENLTFNLYTGPDFQNNNTRRSVFKFFDDFRGYTDNQPIDNYKMWEINTLAGENEKFGRADIKSETITDTSLILESQGGKTSISHALPSQPSDDLAVEIKANITTDTGGTTIGFTDGRTNSTGNMKTGYTGTLNQDSKIIKNKTQKDFGVVNENILKEETGSLSEGEVYVQTFSWNEENFSLGKDYSYIQTSAPKTFKERYAIHISAEPNTKVKIDWIRVRKNPQNQPNVNTGDLKDVKTERPEIISAKPDSRTIEGFGFAKLDIDEVDYSHLSESNLQVKFVSPNFGTLGYDTIKETDSPPLASATWPDLKHDRTYQWYAVVCDKHLNCNQPSPSDYYQFEIDHNRPQNDIKDTTPREDLFQGLRGDDYQPQGFYEAESEVEGDAQPNDYRTVKNETDNWVTMTRDYSNQLEPDQNQTLLNKNANPDVMHRYFNFIDESGEDNDPLWFDTLATSDRADQYSLAPERNWAVDTTGKPYPPGKAYIRTEMFTDINSSTSREFWIRQEREDKDRPKASRAMSNSIAVEATDGAFDISGYTEGFPGKSGNLIKGPIYESRPDIGDKLAPGMGYWIDPDILKNINPNYNDTLDNSYYKSDLENLVHNSGVISINGPSTGVGYHLPEEYDNGKFTRQTHPDTVDTIIGDFYWEKEYLENQDDPLNNSQVPEQLNPYMCGDDKNEYLLEELGDVNNSKKNQGRYACISTNEKCISWEAGEGNNGRKSYEIGEYANTESIDEPIGRAKNSKERCMRYSYEYPRFQDTNINKDQMPAWYSQDFSPQVCNENTLFSEEEGIRWINRSQIESQPFAFKGGINDDLNPYLYTSKDLSSELDLYEYNDSLKDKESIDLNLESNRQTIVPTGVPNDVPQFSFHGNKSVTAGFCGGDDQGEHFKYQECNTDYCKTDTDTIAITKTPEKCVLETNVTLFEGAVPGFDQTKGNSGFEPGTYKGEIGQRRIYEEKESVTIKTNAGDRPITCFEGKWFDDDQWPLVHDIENKYTINLGENLGVPFQILNPTDEAQEFQISYTAQSDISPFTDFTATENQQYTVEVAPESLRSEIVAIEGGKVIEDSPDSDNQINITVESTENDRQESKAFKVVVKDQPSSAVGSGSKDTTELPGTSTPVIIITMTLLTVVKILS